MKVKVVTSYSLTRKQLIEAVSNSKPYPDLNEFSEVWILDENGKPIEPIDDDNTIEFTIEKIEEIE